MEICWLAREPPCRSPAWPGAGEAGADVRAQRDQAQVVAAVERQLDDAPVLDDRADRRVLGGDERDGGGDFSRFRDGADVEREVDAERLLDVQLHLSSATVLKPCSSALT